MEFDANRPIYLQICDSVCDRVLSGELEQGERIPSPLTIVHRKSDAI